MNLYSKDFLLDGKIVYYQLKKGYRSGIEPIILASNAKKKHNKILDMGSGCGSISLIVAYRNPESEVCLLYTSPSPRDLSTSRMPSSA